MTNTHNWAVEYNKIVELYHKESDRGAGVLAPGFIDKCLEDCLRAFFVDDPYIDRLFEENGPLSDSYGKASIAFALGLINKDMLEDLKYLRKIRNKFAHEPTIGSFDESPIRDWCSNLSMAKSISQQGGDIFQESRPRFQFLLTAGMVILRLYRIAEVQQRRTIPIFLPPENYIRK